MLFNNLEEEIEYKTYSKEEKRIGIHLSIPRTIAENLNEFKAMYDKIEIDNLKFEKSLFVGMVLNEFFKGITDSEEDLVEVMGKMKLFKHKEGL